MICDDTMSEIAFMKKVLEDNGHQCVFVQDSLKAEEFAKKENPDVIILDVVMPEKNGFQVCRSIKKVPELQEKPVILATTKGTDSDKAWGFKQGATDYLVKPFSPEEFIEVLNKHS